MIRLIKIFALFSVMLLSMYIPDKSVCAAPAEGTLQEEKQPSGEKFNAGIKGDEWFNYIATETGDLIVKGTDGYWYYGEPAFNGLKKGDAKYKIDSKPWDAQSIDDVKALKEKKLNYLKKSEIGLSPMQMDVSSSRTAVMQTDAVALNIKKPTGPHKVLVLLVSFSDVTIANTEDIWTNSFFGSNGKTVKTYYEEVSGGKFYFAPVQENYEAVNDGVVSVTLNYAHPNTGQNTSTLNRKIVWDALMAADANVDFSSLDTNGNGNIDYEELHVMTVIAGYEAANSLTTIPSIWAHHWSLFNDESPRLDGKYVSKYPYGGYTQIGEIQKDHKATIGVACHELAHDLGLPDLYDTSGASKGVGVYSLMGSGNWGSEYYENSGTSPVHLDAWSKMALGFATPIVASSGSYNIKAAANGYTVLKVPTSDPNQYFLVENRQLTGFDIGLGPYSDYSSGIAIWHIDENVIASKMLSNTVNADDSHKGVDLEEANEVSYGGSQMDDKNSKWQPYENYYYAGNNSTFNSNTAPNSKLYNGIYTHISINIPEVSSDTMMVYVDHIPVAVDDTYSVKAGQALSIAAPGILSNDTDKDGNNLTATSISPISDASKGTLTVNADGSFKFMANASASGSVTFTYKVKDGTNVSDNVAMVTINITTQYIVTFNSNGGTGISRQSLNFNEIINEPTVPKRTGYTFVGWYKESTCVNAWVFTTNKVTKNMTLYAKWRINSYIVRFNSQGGSIVTSKIANYNTTIKAPTAPIRTGYTFVGWYKETTCINVWNFTTDKAVANKTLYAKWIVNPSSPTNLKATRVSSTGIKLTWSGVSGASGYEIYRATSSTGAYGLIKTTTSLYYTNTGLSTGKIYYYKIRAYRIVGTFKVYGNWTTVVRPKL